MYMYDHRGIETLYYVDISVTNLKYIDFYNTKT